MKSITIESSTQLWSLLKSREEIFESNRNIKRFMLVTEKFIKGCQCGSDNEMLMNNEWNNLKNDTEALNLIKSEFSCDELVFL
jgi:hypothetical protein